MVDDLTPTSKVSISAFSILVIITSMFVAATYMRDIAFPYLHTGGNDSGSVPSEVAGVTTNRMVSRNSDLIPTSTASVKIVDEGAGSAAILLGLNSFARVSMLDITFAKTLDLDIETILCEAGYKCVSIAITDDMFRVIISRVSEIQGELWSGEEKVATVEYAPETSGVLVMNSFGVRISEVLEYSTENNLLGSGQKSFLLGEPQF